MGEREPKYRGGQNHPIQQYHIQKGIIFHSNSELKQTSRPDCLEIVMPAQTIIRKFSIFHFWVFSMKNS